MAYNADIATALTMAPQLGTLDATSKPTSTQGAVIWSRAYNEVRAAFRRGRMSDTLTASSVAEGLAQRAEMFLTSGWTLLAKGSLGDKAQATAQELLAQAREALDDIASGELWLTTEGATAEAANALRFVHSHQVDDADPDFDFTAGTGDRQYAKNAVWPEDSDAL